MIDNVSLLSPELLSKTGWPGHEVARKKPGEPLHWRVDSFCVETDVHHPANVNLLWDAMRCTVRTAAKLADGIDFDG